MPRGLSSVKIANKSVALRRTPHLSPFFLSFSLSLYYIVSLSLSLIVEKREIYLPEISLLKPKSAKLVLRLVCLMTQLIFLHNKTFISIIMYIFNIIFTIILKLRILKIIFFLLKRKKIP